nr:purine-nucleoside phosphorylase [Peptoniphilus raoultii]
MENKVIEAVKHLEEKIKNVPEIGIILGSGLGNFAEVIEEKIEIPYGDIPNFQSSTVKGHDGKLIFGKIAGKYLVAMKGRIHYYEGKGIEASVFPIKVLCALKIKKLIVTNAAGGVNKDFKAGDLMIIRDHVNFAQINPLIGPNDEEIGPRFPDMTYSYSKELIKKAEEVGEKLNINLQKGVYFYFTGPTYETPAEVKMAGILGADAVGMSTVPEVIVARHRGLEVLGISAITNMAAGILDKPLDHKEVMESGKLIEGKFQKLVKGVIENI